MAFLGDLGKAFGLGTTQEVGGTVGATIGSIFGPAGRIAGENIGRDLGKDLGEIGSDADVATSPAQAGVDSTATLTNVSQTGQLAPVGTRTTMASSPNMAGAAVFGLPGLVTGVARTLSRPGVGGLIGGVAAGAAVDTVVDMFGNTKKLVITRKLQRDVKKVFMLSGGNFSFVSANSMRLFGKSLSEDQIVEILFKTFKNQGPYITKAAMRKTSSTLRKLDRMCSMRDAMRPPARRRATTTRKMSTNITQVK